MLNLSEAQTESPTEIFKLVSGSITHIQVTERIRAHGEEGDEQGKRIEESMMRSWMGLPSVFSHFAPQQGASERRRRTEREGQAVTAMDEGLRKRSARWDNSGDNTSSGGLVD